VFPIAADLLLKLTVSGQASTGPHRLGVKIRVQSVAIDFADKSGHIQHTGQDSAVPFGGNPG
jgi:hypothetical protein